MINRTCVKCGKEFVGYSDDCGCQGNIPVPVKSITPKKSWFKRHLNLTWLFWMLGAYFLASFLKVYLGIDIIGTSKYASAAFFCWGMLPVNGWVLYQKGRSLHWLWLAFWIPIIPIILSNKKTSSTVAQTTNATDLTKKNTNNKDNG
jgi:hypothetical protein